MALIKVTKTNNKRRLTMSNNNTTTIQNLIASLNTVGKSTVASTRVIAKELKDSNVTKVAKEYSRIATDQVTNVNLRVSEEILKGSLTLAAKIREKSEQYAVKAESLRVEVEEKRIPATSTRIDTINQLIDSINKK